jgi:hypothetical protein
MKFGINPNCGFPKVEGVLADVVAVGGAENFTYLKLIGDKHGYELRGNATRIADCGERVRIYYDNEEKPGRDNLEAVALEVLGKEDGIPTFVWVRESRLNGITAIL